MPRAILFLQNSCKVSCEIFSRYIYFFLSKSPRVQLFQFLQNHPNVILSKTQSKIHKLGGEMAYAQYVRHLEKTSPSVVARDAADGLTVESFGRGYEDYLQAPLQVSETVTVSRWFIADFAKPLMDNLASVTYEVFEKDPVKYRQYEQVRNHLGHLAGQACVYRTSLLGSLPSIARPASRLYNVRRVIAE